MIPSNTPPNGDFVRYVERLSGAPVAAGSKEDLRAPQHSPVGIPVGVNAGLPTGQGVPNLLTGKSIVSHLMWIVFAFVITQALRKFIPGVGFLFFPILLAYVAWVIFKANRDSSGALMQRMRDLAKQAAEEAQKAQQAQRNNKR